MCCVCFKIFAVKRQLFTLFSTSLQFFLRGKKKEEKSFIERSVRQHYLLIFLLYFAGLKKMKNDPLWYSKRLERQFLNTWLSLGLYFNTYKKQTRTIGVEDRESSDVLVSFFAVIVTFVPFKSTSRNTNFI